jgi:hypothetical protein
MDIRDINENVEYPGMSAFNDMFALQQLLVDHYTDIEKLPEAPVDLNTKTGQDLVKDFTGRIIEELGEGFESYLLMLDMFHSGQKPKDMIPHLQNFNEEISDALHFWLELMIFSGYDMSTLTEWVGTYLVQGSVKGQDQLGAWFNLGEVLVLEDTKHKKIPCWWVIKDHMLEDEFLRGGRQLGSARRDFMKQFLWDITYHLQIARNTLKNKPWKQTQMTTDFKQYEEGHKKATAALFKFLSFAGFTKESLYVIYYKKNKVNQFRIKSKY